MAVDDEAKNVTIGCVRFAVEGETDGLLGIVVTTKNSSAPPSDAVLGELRMTRAEWDSFRTEANRRVDGRYT